MPTQVKTPPDNLLEARRWLLRNHPFYAMPIFGSQIVLTLDIPHAATDGKSIWLNSKFIARMPVPHLSTVLAHEGIHILCGHPDMMAKKKWADGTPLIPEKLNRAADEWINNNIGRKEGMQFPTNITPLMSAKYMNMEIRRIYNLLPDAEPDNKGQGSGQGANGQGKGKAGEGDNPLDGRGGLTEGDDCVPYALSPEEVTEARIKVRQAFEAAKSHGKVPAWAEQFVDELANPKVDYRSLLLAWLRSATSKEDVSYRQLNRRYLPDFYAPILTDTTFGKLAVGLDTSGSCWSKAPNFLSEFQGMLTQLKPTTTLLIPFDTEVKHPKEFGPGEILDISTYKVYGGGGTDFRPLFKYLETQQIDALIVLTDMWGDFPTDAPNYPVFWISITEEVNTQPFGTLVNAPEI